MRLTLGIVLLSLLPIAPAAANPGHGNGKPKHAKARPAVTASYFQPRDVEIVREYYEPRSRSLPPGLAKKYYRTGHLPPGWQKKMEPLPPTVERRLVVLPAAYRRGYIDGSVVVYSPRTQVIVDVVSFGGR